MCASASPVSGEGSSQSRRHAGGVRTQGRPSDCRGCMAEHRAWGWSRAEPASQCRLHAAERGSTLRLWGRFLQPGRGSSGQGRPRALQEAGAIPGLNPVKASVTHLCVAVSSETTSGRVSCPSRPHWCAGLCEVRRKPPTFLTPALLGQSLGIPLPGECPSFELNGSKSMAPGSRDTEPSWLPNPTATEPGEMRQVGETPEWGSRPVPPPGLGALLPGDQMKGLQGSNSRAWQTCKPQISARRPPSTRSLRRKTLGNVHWGEPHGPGKKEAELPGQHRPDAAHRGQRPRPEPRARPPAWVIKSTSRVSALKSLLAEGPLWGGSRKRTLHTLLRAGRTFF